MRISDDYEFECSVNSDKFMEEIHEAVEHVTEHNDTEYVRVVVEPTTEEQIEANKALWEAVTGNEDSHRATS